jgi:hypothetical protein
MGAKFNNWAYARRCQAQGTRVKVVWHHLDIVALCARLGSSKVASMVANGTVLPTDRSRQLRRFASP